MLPSVSIIIPVFNAESFLPDCIESLSSQNYNQYEVIFIDDCSNDKSCALIEEAQKLDSRIVLIRQEKNQGPMVARNLGLNESRGKYITFCDSDDFLTRDGLENMVAKLESYPEVDVVIGNYQYCNGEGELGLIVNNRLRFGESVEGYTKSLLSSEVSHALWAKLYRSSVLKGHSISAYEGMIQSEDVYVTYQSLPYVRQVMSIDDIVYIYRRNSQSTTQSIFSLKRFKGIVMTLKIQSDFFYQDYRYKQLFLKKLYQVTLCLLRSGVKLSVLQEMFAYLDVKETFSLCNFPKYFGFDKLLRSYLSYIKSCMYKKKIKYFDFKAMGLKNEI